MQNLVSDIKGGTQSVVFESKVGLEEIGEMK
jgi:hypothetical protein